MGAAVAPLREDRKNSCVGRGAGGGGAGEINAQQRGLPPPFPGCSSRAAGACSPGFYFRPTGGKNVFFATGRMFPQTELLIRGEDGRNVLPVVAAAGFFSSPSPPGLSRMDFWPWLKIYTPPHPAAPPTSWPLFLKIWEFSEPASSVAQL